MCPGHKQGHVRLHDVQSAIGVQTRAPQTAVWGSVLHQPGHLSRHRQVETPSVAQRKAWLEAERHPGLVSLTRTDFRHLKSSQGPARTARSAKAGLGRFFFVECRFIRIPHLHQTRRTGAGESLAPRLLATRYYYRTRSGDAPEKTASRNCAASSYQCEGTRGFLHEPGGCPQFFALSRVKI